MSVSPGTISEVFSRPFVAAASLDGAHVDQHLGAAERVLVYQPHSERLGVFVLREIRQTPPRGGGDARWRALAEVLRDCRALLVMAGGPRPRAVLEESGVRVILMEGAIEEGLRAVYRDEPVPEELRRSCGNCGCGTGQSSCGGSGGSCGRG